MQFDIARRQIGPFIGEYSPCQGLLVRDLEIHFEKDCQKGVRQVSFRVFGALGTTPGGAVLEPVAVNWAVSIDNTTKSAEFTAEDLSDRADLKSGFKFLSAA